MRRKWIGIDITHLAIGLIEFRLRDIFGELPHVVGAPGDLAAAHDLFRRDPFQFEAWAVTRLTGIQPNEHQRGDGGVDGVGRFYIGRGSNGRERYGKILVSVKGGQRLGVGMIRDFRGALERERADIGIFICLHDANRGMHAEAASADRFLEIDGWDFPRMQIFPISAYFLGRHPKLPPTIQESRRASGATHEQHRLL